ncbi:MAG: hypothetical protein JXQ96_07680 [Cyclobacteriaceae bacterium]
MNCGTGKVSYASKEMAEEALIQNHSRNYYSTGSGPVNVYQCDACGEYHFTSKGDVSDLLKSPESQKKIAKNQEAHHWEQKWRGR